MTTGPMAPYHRRAVAIVIVSTLVALAVATGSLVAVFYQHLDANLKTGQRIQHLAKKKHTGPKAPLDILVMGLDTRDCAGCHIDNEPGGDGSDTTILVHISADRRSAYGISIPRDALVKPVACTQAHHYAPDGVDTGLVEWNEAYAAGGADCTAEQLEKNFGVYIDDYVTVNFGGFKGMVDAIGGVDVCIPYELDDPTYEHVDFKPGTSVHLNGDKSLKYVRLRHATDDRIDGSDLGRMKRQQYFISVLIHNVISAKTLARPDHVLAFANTLTKSIMTSPGLGHVKDLVKLGNQLKHIDLADIRFISVPNEVYDVPRTDPLWGRVKILPSAKKLWQRVIADKPLSKELAAGSLSASNPPGSPSGTPSSTPGSTPSDTPSSPTGSTTPSGEPSNSQAAQDAAKVGLCA